MVAVIRENQVTTSLPKTVVLFGQYLGYRAAYTHASSEYTHVLIRRSNEIDFSTNEDNLETVDFDVSANITGTSKTEVITNVDFITTAQFLQPLIISGRCSAVVNLSCRGDNVYTTSIDSCRLTILKRSSTGVETQLAQEEYPQVANQPIITHQFEYYTIPISFTLTSNVSETSISNGDAVILRVEVFGHSSNASASNNKIKLHFKRGTVDTLLLLSVVEDS
jgi:hypothetical protein